MNLEINKIDELKEENEKLKKEVERLQAFEPTLVRLALENGTLDVHMKCTEIMHILADLFAKWLELQKAENYTETSATINAAPLKFSAKFGYDILITIQKLSKPTPHELRVKAEQKNKELIQGLLQLERDIVENPSTAKELCEIFITKATAP